MARCPAVVYQCLYPAHHHWAEDFPPLQEQLRRLHDDGDRAVTTQQIIDRLGIEPTPMTDAVAATVAWFRDRRRAG